MAKILIADDEEDMRSLLTIWVESAGHTVVAEVASCDDAFSAIKELSEVDVAILDHNLSHGGDGAKIAVCLRGKFPNVSVVSLSTMKQTYGDEGANLVKPVKRNEFFEALARVIGQNN